MTLVAAGVVWLGRSRVLSVLVLPATLFHEAGHAVTAEAVGGDVGSLTVAGNGSGLTRWSAPADLATWRGVAVASAGYLAAVAGGLVLLWAGVVGRALRGFLIGLAALVLVVAVLWVPWSDSPGGGGDGRFTWVVSLVAVAAATGLAFAPRQAQQVVLVFVGATFVLVGLDAIRYLVGLDAGLHSDAESVHDLTGLPAWIVAVTWLVVAGAATWWLLRHLLAPPEPAGGSPEP